MGFSLGQYGSLKLTFWNRPFEMPLHPPSYELDRLAAELKAAPRPNGDPFVDPLNHYGKALKDTVIYYEGLRDKLVRSLGPDAERVQYPEYKKIVQEALPKLNEALERLYIEVSGNNGADVFHYLNINRRTPALEETYRKLDLAAKACQDLLTVLAVTKPAQESFWGDAFEPARTPNAAVALEANASSEVRNDTEGERRKEFREKIIQAISGELVKCAIDPNAPPDLRAKTAKALALQATNLVYDDVLFNQRRSPSEAREIALAVGGQIPDELGPLTSAFDRILQAAESGDINDPVAIKQLVRQTMDEFGVPLTSGLDYKILENMSPQLRQMLLKLAPEMALAQSDKPSNSQGDFAVQTSATHEFLLEQMVSHQWQVAAKSRVVQVQTTQRPVEIKSQTNFRTEDGTLRTFFEAVQPVEVETIVELDFVTSCKAAHLALLTALQNGELTESSSNAIQKSGEPVSEAIAPPADGQVLHLQDEILSDIRGRVRAWVECTMKAQQLFDSGFKVESISSRPLRSLGWEAIELPNDRPDTSATRVRLRYVGDATVQLLAQSAIDVTTDVSAAVADLEEPEITMEKR